MQTKFERDKVYKTRDGRGEWTVIATGLRGPWGSIAAVSKEGNIWRFTEDGRYVGYAGDGAHDYDLMPPKPEPIVEWGRSEGVGFVPFFGGEDAARSNPYGVPGRLAKRVTTFED